MNKTIAILILLITPISASAQNTSDSIEIRKPLGTIYLQNGKRLSNGNLLTITKSNPEAYKEMQKASSNLAGNYIFGLPGGFLLGWPLGTAIGGGKPKWVLAGIGAGLVIASIPFSIAYKNHAKNAVRLYNDGLKKTSSADLDFKIGLTPDGVGIKLTL